MVLGLRPKTALLHDANRQLIEFYRWLQRGLDARAIGVPLTPRHNDREIYGRYRARFNELIAIGASDSAEAATLFYYLNRTGFNGLCRFNSSGFFNVPFGRYRRIVYKEQFEEYRAALQPYTFSHGDFESITPADGDFIYADPPYDVEFTAYSAGGFDWKDQERLANWLKDHGGPVIASNQATPRIKKLYRRLGFHVETISAPRRISCDGNRENATEMLAFKNI